ncbi:hypothetical protein RUM43_000877 [Polyplax serrata]|uniref:Uncharacterized protein n=1 Tax=Polyplax serrata TaxID=468196 RepID=A0AAN8SD44_POLSC
MKELTMEADGEFRETNAHKNSLRNFRNEKKEKDIENTRQVAPGMTVNNRYWYDDMKEDITRPVQQNYE